MRFLILLDQFTLDPASGAVRSLVTAGQLLAGCAQEVVALGTLRLEGRDPPSFQSILNLYGIEPARGRRDGAHVLEFHHRGVRHLLVEHEAPGCPGPLDTVLDRVVAEFSPELVMTFGSLPAEQERRRRLQCRCGIKVVFFLFNYNYPDAASVHPADAVISCSRFVREHYARKGIESIDLPLPVDMAEVVAAEHDPVFVTFVNPEPRKGLMLIARVAEELGCRRQDIPMLIVQGRGVAKDFRDAGLRGGFDLSRHKNLFYSPPVALPRTYLQASRIVLMPSVWREPAGRVAVEALCNGIPVIASDRGGLPEVCRGGATHLRLPAHVTEQCEGPMSAADVAEWVELLEKWTDDTTAYAHARQRALATAATYEPGIVAGEYLAFARRTIAGTR